jgi:hypothetical protein
MATSRSLPLTVSFGFLVVRCASNRRSAKPIPWTGPSASGSIGGVRKFAFVDGKASASDALRQAILDTLEFDNPLVDPLRPSAREARPISARRDTIGRKLAEFRADFLEGKPDPLREDNKRDPAQYRARITAMPGATTLRRN